MASYLILSTLREKFARDAFTAAEVLASFINANKWIKGIRIGDHEIKIVNSVDSTTIFLRDITCLDRIQAKMIAQR